MIQMVENHSGPSQEPHHPGAEDQRRRLSRLFTAVEQSRLLANDKMVLKSMIGAASRSGFELNSQQKDIARRARVSEATVSRSLRRLLARELLVERTHFGRKHWLVKQERILALPDEPVRLPPPQPQPSPVRETERPPGPSSGRPTPISREPATRRNRTGKDGSSQYQSRADSSHSSDGQNAEPAALYGGQGIVITIPTELVSTGLISLLTRLLEAVGRTGTPVPASQPPRSREPAGPSRSAEQGVTSHESEIPSESASAGTAISRKSWVADDVWSGSFVKSRWTHPGPHKSGLSGWHDKGNKCFAQFHNASGAAVKPVQLQREMHLCILDATSASEPSSEQFLPKSSILGIQASSSSSSSTPQPEIGQLTPESVKIQGSLSSPQPSLSSGLAMPSEPHTTVAESTKMPPSPPPASTPAGPNLASDLQESLSELALTDEFAAGTARYFLSIIQEMPLASGRFGAWPQASQVHLQAFLHELPSWLAQQHDVLQALLSWHEYLLTQATLPGRPFLPPFQSFERQILHLADNKKRTSLRAIQLALHPAESQQLPESHIERTHDCRSADLTESLESRGCAPIYSGLTLPAQTAKDGSHAEYLRLMHLTGADWTSISEENWLRPPAAPTPMALTDALRQTLWHVEERCLPDWQRKERHKAQLDHHERERWIGAPSLRMLLPHLPQYLQLPALRLYHLCWTGGFAYLYGPEWQLMDVLASALFQSRWEDDAQYGPAVRDDAELANLLFPKEERNKGDTILRYHDCFLELGVAPPRATALILHELLHRRKHAAPGGITLLTCRYSPTELCQRLATVSPGTDHSLRELLPSLISDRCIFVGRKNPGKAQEAGDSIA